MLSIISHYKCSLVETIVGHDDSRSRSRVSFNFQSKYLTQLSLNSPNSDYSYDCENILVYIS